MSWRGLGSKDSGGQCVSRERGSLSGLSLPPPWHWHAYSVAVHSCDPVHKDGCPSSRSHRPHCTLTQRLLGQGKWLCGRPATENKPGEDHLLSCQWSWIWIWIWGQHRGWVRHWGTDQSERAGGRGKVRGEYLQEGTKQRELDRKWEIVVFMWGRRGIVA